MEAYMNKVIKKPESELPKLTGVYFFKNSTGQIIYIGKAKNLKNRINSYFQKYATDWKIGQLLDEYATIEHIITPTETESLLLEAQLVQQYKPKFNVLLKDGQPFVYIMITNSEIPIIEVVRNKKRKGTYFGPFLEKQAARKAHKFLLQTFQLNLCNKKIENGCLDYHIGTCAGSCKSDFNITDYQFRMSLAIDVLKNNQNDFVHKVTQQINQYNSIFAFEKARHLNEYLTDMNTIFTRLKIYFDEKKFSTDIFVASTPTPYTNVHNNTINNQLQSFFHSKTPIRTIDCFDISHFQSNSIVGSCVRFTDGKPDKHLFRRFKIKTLTQQNDYAALQEIIQRRYKETSDIPDLIVIDGGKGQLSATQQVMPHAPLVSLAKREEILYGPQFPNGIHLDVKTDVGRLLIALRDYAHHFAISYHRLKRSKTYQQ